MNGTEQPGDGTFDLLVGWANILGATFAALAVVVALGTGTSWYQSRRLVALRRRSIGKALAAGGGHAVSFRHFRRVTRTMIRLRLDRPGSRVVDELVWLTELATPPRGSSDTRPSGPTVAPFTFPDPAHPHHEECIERVASAYLKYAGQVRRRWILRSTAGALVQDEYTLALQTATALMSYAGQVFLPEAQSRSPAQGTWIQCGSVESPEKVRLVSWPDVSLGRSPLHFSSVIASYVPYRVITASGTGRKRASRSMAFRQISETAADRERERRSKNGDKLLREFDGVMTRLHEPGVRVEVDPFSGRQRLHLCVSETTFFAFRATQWREFGCSDRGADSYASRLLSTNLLLVDDHGRAILVQRAGTISHGGRFAGTVTGACEVVGREGISPDVDSNGLPDLMRTLRREALEELGISLEEPEAKLRAAGVIQVETNRDMRTFVLVATARYPGPVTGFRIKRGSTDDLEGTWELGEKAMVLDLPKAMATRESLFEFVAWLRGSTQIVAHGVGSLLLLVTMRLEKGLAPSELPAASLADLTDALAQEIHENPPQTPQCVSLQSLWEGEQGSAEEI